MAEENQNPEETEEYKPQEDFSTEEGGYVPSSPAFFNKRFLIILGVVLVAFVIYHFVKPKKGLKVTTEEQTAAQVQQATTPEVIAGAEIGRVAQQTNDNKEKITTLQRSLNDIQSRITELTNALATLNATTNKLSKDVEQLQKAKVVAKPKLLPKPAVLYHIRAIVSGRAWLESTDNVTITVRPGSRIKGYGVIKNINPDTGIITTSSGLTIKYGTDDI